MNHLFVHLKKQFPSLLEPIKIIEDKISSLEITVKKLCLSNKEFNKKEEQYKNRIAELEVQLQKEIETGKSWKEAWFVQRDATGKNYLVGFEKGYHCTQDPYYGYTKNDKT